MTRASLQPGEPAPDFALPAVHRAGSVSLSDYRGRSPVLVVLLRGLYWAFCRRQLVELGRSAAKLKELGVETLAVIASPAERARLYFRYRPVPLATAADPDLFTHRAFGVPNTSVTPEIWETIEGKASELARDLRVQVQPGQAYAAIDALDGFEKVETDAADIQRHQVQFTGQFLLDRDGVVRWANIECASGGLDGLDRFPTDEELMAAARAL